MGSPTRRLCLDTGLLIQYLRRTSPGREATKAALHDFECTVTVFTVYELMLGSERTGRDIGEADLLAVLEILPFDEDTARRAAQLQSALISRNQRIGILDMLIAAICLTHNLPLLTLNARDFSRVPDLTILTPEDVLSPPGNR